MLTLGGFKWGSGGLAASAEESARILSVDGGDAPEFRAMNSAAVDFIHFFRIPSDIPSDKPGADGETAIVEEDEVDQLSEEERYILCRQCRQAVTRETDRIAVQGAHRHTFANPHGIVFEIGCFKNTISCGYAGEATDEFSWFAGYRWRVCFCSLCLTHLGWIFSSNGDDTFHGLILDRLIEPE
jgi:hypothetical protein